MFNTKQLITLAVSSLLVGMLGSALVSANSQEMEDRPPRGEFQELVDKDVTILDNGVQIVLTTEDAEALERLQSREERAPKGENATAVRELLSDGVRVTITSTDAEEVERIQQHAERGPRAHGPRGEGERGCDKGAGGEAPLQ